jgi:hypothetical protein
VAQAQPLTVPRECIERALSFDSSAEAFFAVGDEWAAVVYFYASYHRVRGAILSDPVFESLVELPKVDPNLMNEHRATTRHEGRMAAGRRDIGVNDLVRMLYRPIYGDYLTLHDASVNVRYARGVSEARLEDTRAAWDRIRTAQDAGALVWAAPRTVT